MPLIVVDEVGYIPFDPEAANLMFSLVSARYERAWRTEERCCPLSDSSLRAGSERAELGDLVL